MTAVQQYKDEVRVRRALAVMDYQVEHGCSVQEACEAWNVAERSFYRWLNEGIVDADLNEAAGSRQRIIRDIAIRAVENRDLAAL